MPKLFIINDEWSEQKWFNTGGTRAKKYLQSPEGKYYYFKKSYKKEVIDYTYEFWSEIIASEVGKLLGFNMLQYDLAVIGDEMGCICQSMIESDEQELNEGGKYLQAYDNAFDPEIKSTRSQYSFQLIEQSFSVFDLGVYIEQIIEIIIFDALIGNGDRHQENWAFITTYGRISKFMATLENDVKEPLYKKLPKWFKKFFNFHKIVDEERQTLTEAGNLVKLYYLNVEKFSPIYDNGSSLGRELELDKIERMLKNEKEFKAYIRRGTSEIHWKGEKISHFELIERLLNSSYCEIVTRIVARVVEKFDDAKIEQIVNEIDTLVPKDLLHYQLPLSRKHLIIKMILLRFEKLRELAQ